MSFNLVIFDCDGVLFDSKRANEAFYNHIRQRFGFPEMTPSQTDFVHMATTTESVEHIIPEGTLREQALEYCRNLDYEPFNRLIIMEPHLLDLLSFLRPGRKTAVCTNRGTSIGPLLERYGLAAQFDTVVSCLDVSRPKPDPESVLLILDRLGIAAEKTLYVGDAVTDALAAKGAGVVFIAYRNPNLEAAYHINGLDEVQRIVAAG
jgi:HAD superfamily hydrolase (TIGR01509 family)